jgi:hypothetical protein
MTKDADAGAGVPTNLEKTLNRAEEETGVSVHRLRSRLFTKGDMYRLIIQRWTYLINVLLVGMLMPFILLTSKHNAEEHSCEDGPVN